jgi:preprotein translocase subunit SecA
MYVILISLLLMLVYGGYWAAVYVVNKLTGVGVPVIPWFDYALYVMFWVGVVLFAVGLAMVVAGVVLDAMEMKAKYASFKRS